MAEQTYTTEQLLAFSEATRYEMFLTAWERHLKAGLEPTQKEADRLAAMYHTKATVAQRPQSQAQVRVFDGKGN